jgi:uncharacterized protein
VNQRALVVLALSAITALCPLAVAVGQGRVELDSSSVLVTSGSGEIRLPPDHAVIRFTVGARAQSAAAASAASGAGVRTLVGALNAIRLPEESVQVVGVSVRPNQDYQTGVLRNHEATAEVRMAIRNLERLGRLLDAGLASGATGLSDVDFRADSAEVAQRTALARAFAEARANAEAIARAAGAVLGPLVRVSTSPDPDARYFGNGVTRLEGITVTGGVAIAPRDIVVGATLYTTWRLRAAR